MCSGKSSLIDLLYRATGLAVLSIDDYRRRYNHDASWRVEQELYRWMLDDIKVLEAKGESYLVEITGASMSWPLLLHAATKATVIRLHCSMDTCISRYDERLGSGYDMPPVPFDGHPHQSIRSIADILDLVPYDIHLSSEQHTSAALFDRLGFLVKRYTNQSAGQLDG